MINITEFEDKLVKIRVDNGWDITFEFFGVWRVSVLERPSGVVLAATGATSLAGVLYALENFPLDHPVWENG